MKHGWRLAGAAAQLGHTLELHLLKKRGCFRRQRAAQAIPGRKLSQSSCSQRCFKYTKQKELPQSPELPCACTEFTRHFDTLWPPRNTARHLPCPFLTASAKRGHKASISARVHHLSLPVVHCSAAQLSTCGKSRHRAGQHSPELPESHQAQPQLQSCTGTERCSLLFIARISSGFHRLQSPTRLPTCQHLPGMSPRHTALCPMRPPWFHSLHFNVWPSQDLGVPVQPRAAGAPTPTWCWTNRQSYPILHYLCQSHQDKLR